MRKPKVYSFTATNNKTFKLTEKEKKFCEVYCQFGVSGIDAVIQAGYEINGKNTAYSIASENLRKPKILAYIEQLYKEYKFTDDDVMHEHYFLIKQHQDLTSKARAIDMYYKKRGLYSPDKQENMTVVVTKYTNSTDVQLQGEIDRLMNKTKQ